MNIDRRAILGLGMALPFVSGALRAAEPPAASLDPANAWCRLFAGAPDDTFAWWYQGTLFAHVDGLREFPVVGLHAIMICRTTPGADGDVALDFRTIGCFSDLDTGEPTDRWDNPFTSRRQAIPVAYVEGPGRYAMHPTPGGATVVLTSAAARINRVIVTGEMKEGHQLLTQVEGTLQGFPRLDGTLPPLDDPLVTERQTRLQWIAPLGAATAARGYFTHVYDALPPWMGFGERLGSGLSKGVMRRAAADQALDQVVWAHLKKQMPGSFARDRLTLT